MWLLLNTYLVRPFFKRVNLGAFLHWKCTPASYGPPGDAAPNTTGLEVIVAGAGHTGTTSVQLALERLGLRTYHADDIGFYLPEFQLLNVTADMLGWPLRTCMVGAFIVEPRLEITWDLLRVSPGAKVILMTRDWPGWVEAWRQQASKMYAFIALQVVMGWTLCHWLPHGLLWPSTHRGNSFVEPSLTSLFLENCLVYTGYWQKHHYVRPTREPPLKHSMVENRTIYEEYMDSVRARVPARDFLEFDVRRHGWAELGAFLGRAVPAAGTPFPRVRTKRFCTAFLARWQMAPLKHACFWLLMVASIAANWFVYCWLSRSVCACLGSLGGRARRKED